MKWHLGIRNANPLMKCLQTPSHTAYPSEQESLLEVIHRSPCRALRIWASEVRGSNLVGVHIVTSFTDPSWQEYSWTTPVLKSIKISATFLCFASGQMCKALLGPFPWRSGCFMLSAWLHQVCSTRPRCRIVSLWCFLDWKAEDADFHLEMRCKYRELSASILLLYLLVAGFLLELKVQSRTQEEIVFLLRERFISPYLSQPRRRYLILRQLFRLPL